MQVVINDEKLFRLSAYVLSRWNTVQVDLMEDGFFWNKKDRQTHQKRVIAWMARGAKEKEITCENWGRISAVTREEKK